MKKVLMYLLVLTASQHVSNTQAADQSSNDSRDVTVEHTVEPVDMETAVISFNESAQDVVVATKKMMCATKAVTKHYVEQLKQKAKPAKELLLHRLWTKEAWNTIGRRLGRVYYVAVARAKAFADNEYDDYGNSVVTPKSA